MLAWALFVIAGCGFGLDNNKVDPCVVGQDNCCTGTLETIGPNGPALQVIAEMACPEGVGRWEVTLDSLTLGAGEGEAEEETTSLNIDLGDLSLADGTHTLTLTVAPTGDLPAKDVATAEVVYDNPDTGDTGDTADTGDTDSDTSETTDTTPQLPEVQPGDVVLDPEQGARGDSLDLSFTVYSYGEVGSDPTVAEVYWSTDLTLDPRDTLLTTLDVPALATGTNTALAERITIPSDAALGDAFVLVSLDPDEEIEEADESNNLAYGPVEVAGPDLGVASITLSDSSGSGNVDVMATWVIENTGGARSDAFTAKVVWSTDEAYDAGDLALDTWEETPLDAGDSRSDARSVRVPDTTEDGWVLLVLDPDGTTEDLDRSNNALGASYATEAVDLTITVDGVSPSTGSAGETVTVSMTLGNLGTDRAEAFDIAIYWSADATWDGGDTRLTGASASYLTAGSTSSISLPVTMPSTLGLGTSSLIAVIDEAGSVVETDEANNTAYGTFEVVGPNYVASIQSLGTTTPTPGSPLKVYWTVDNTGSAASSDTYVSLYLSSDASWSADDTQLAVNTLSALGDGGTTGSTSTVINIPLGTSYGTWYVLVFADSGSVLTESDEVDNVAAYAITVS